jgi:predicted DsbA family dithiol-disulfide isomerase
VEKLLQEFAIDIAYTHFPLHPDTPEAGLELEELFAGRNVDIEAVHARLSGLMAEEGLPYGLRTMTYNSRLAQELGKWADTQPGGGKIHDALFRAYFVDNVNLGKAENLVPVAGQVGLPVDEATSVLSGRRFREAVDSDWQRARELGVTGVPTFVIGNQGLVGAQPYEQLQSFVQSAGAGRREDEALKK